LISDFEIEKEKEKEKEKSKRSLGRFEENKSHLPVPLPPHSSRHLSHHPSIS
jgi:hypothetical protein